MSAARRFEVRVQKHPDRVDSVEVVDLDDLEVVLLWDLEAREAAHRAEALRADLRRLDADAFLARWSDA
ncbi:hypothetical protein [Conexibacter sp. SYSU D00693]|uniref:hypothetical protein n=1 Tax=Conexibacter sp. SYSU D00693 TaxID=2812560 RepID=UPI00196BA4FC|nr:hypothetical protein [Conexibacter sp. SYSU D00693]